MKARTIYQRTNQSVPWLGLATGFAMAFPVVSPLSWDGRGVLMSSLQHTIAIAVLVAGMLLGERQMRLPRYSGFLFVVLSLGLLGATFTGTWSDVTAIRMAYLFVLWIAAGNIVDPPPEGNGSTRPSDRRAASAVILTTGCAVAGVCVAEVISGSPLFVEEAFRGTNPFFGTIRAQATLLYPLLTGFVLLACLFVALAGSLGARPKVAVTVVLLAGIAATGGTSAVIVGAAAVIWAALAPRGGGSRVLGIALVFSALVVSLFSSQDLRGVFDDISFQTNVHRMNSILAVPRLLLERPLHETLFGSGWDSVRNLYDRRLFDNDGFYAVDNQFVSLLAFTGVIGFLAYVGLVVTVVWVGRNRSVIVPFLLLVLMGMSFDTLSLAVAGAFLVYFASWAMGSPGTRGAHIRSDSSVRAPGGVAYWVRAHP